MLEMQQKCDWADMGSIEASHRKAQFRVKIILRIVV